MPVKYSLFLSGRLTVQHESSVWGGIAVDGCGKCARSARFEVRDRSPMEVAADGLEHRLRRLLPGGRPPTRHPV